MSELPEKIQQSEKYPDEDCSIILGNCYDKEETAEVVNRCNSQPALLEACKRMLGAMQCDELNNGQVFDDDLRKEVKEIAKAAIAAAKKE